MIADRPDLGHGKSFFTYDVSHRAIPPSGDTELRFYRFRIFRRHSP
jgi:hypothetical protein